MKILACVIHSYYDSPGLVNPFYYFFVETLRRMGHQVVHFDHVEQARLNKDSMNELFLASVRGGQFDCVLVETYQGEFYPEVLDEAKRLTCTVAFNSDDDWRWFDYSASLAPHFSYAVTTYRHIYEAAKPTCPNLLLSAWACVGVHDGLSVPKNIGVSFVGSAYGERGRIVESLRNRNLPIEAFGRGSQSAQATYGTLFNLLTVGIGGRLVGRRGAGKAIRDWMLQRLNPSSGGLGFNEMYDVWNRSKISLTLLKVGELQLAKKLDMARQLGKAESNRAWNPWTSSVQVKSRIFELGLSGTLMLCDRNPEIDDYYERGKEYEDFESLEECADKIRFYLEHDDARRRIAQAYYDRTKREHLWEHRLKHLFEEIGIP